MNFVNHKLPSFRKFCWLQLIISLGLNYKYLVVAFNSQYCQQTETRHFILPLVYNTTPRLMNTEVWSPSA